MSSNYIILFPTNPSYVPPMTFAEFVMAVAWVGRLLRRANELYLVDIASGKATKQMPVENGKWEEAHKDFRRTGDGFCKYRFVQRQAGLLEPGEKIGAVDILGHDEAGELRGAANVMHRHNMGMVQVGHGADLVKYASASLDWAINWAYATLMATDRFSCSS
jgi:hypothetical protein